MTRVTTAQNNFASGEIDPRLVGQVTIKAYEQGLKRARNVQRLATGGLERRFGTYDLAHVRDHGRLMEFEFADDERYVMVASAGWLDVYDLNGVLLQSLAAPWDLDVVFEMTFTQLGDTMVVAHNRFRTRLVQRTGASTFAITTLAFDSDPSGNRTYQPYFKFADAAVTLSPSAVSGAGVVLTASSTSGWGGFEANHVGSRFKVHDTEVLITAVTDSTHATGTVSGTIQNKLDLDPYKTTAGSTSVEVTHVFHGFPNGATVTFSGSNAVGGLTGAQLDGARVITVIDEHHYLVTAGGSATVSEDGGGSAVKVSAANVATRNWLEQSISAVRGYPGACAFHEGRLWLGGTTAQPDAAWGSKALLYFNFDVGEGADGDSVQGAVGSEDISRILHLVSNNELQLFTPMRELVYVTPNGEPIVPGNQRVKSQSVAGSGNVQPVVFDGATLFVQENGKSVSELTYSSEQGGYLAVPVSTLAGHLIEEPVSAAASSGAIGRAEHYAFFVNGDGSVAVFHSLRSENLAGWALWTLGDGSVRSVATIGPYTFFCVEVRGGYRLYRLASDAIVSLDGAVLHSAASATTSWTLDLRVRNRTVHLVSERGYHGEVAVPASGVIELDVAVEQLVAGDAYYALVETLPPLVETAGGPRVRMTRRLVRTVLELYDAYQLTIDGREVDLVGAGGEWDGDLTPFSGTKAMGHLGFSREPTCVISQSVPLPFTLLAVTQEVKV